MKRLADIAAGIRQSVLLGDGDISVGGVTHDSRAIQKGDIFAVIRGATTDGRRFVTDAVNRGAIAVLTDETLDVPVPQIVVPDVRKTLGTAAAIIHGYPTEQLDVAAVTGTNGKTTVVYLLESVLSNVGKKPGVISTVEYRVGQTRWPAAHTTPESTTIQKTASDMVAHGATHLLMEASSHGLVQHRLGGCRVTVAAFTNLTQDHLDYHGTMAAYGAAKKLLFTDVIENNPDARTVVNIDDPFSRELRRVITHPVLTVSVDPASDADIRPSTTPRFGVSGIQATVRIPGDEVGLSSPLIGAHNLSNLLVALGMAISLGIDGRAAAGALQGHGAPGRLERVSGNEGFVVLVDYAHTPDALTNVLKSLKPLTKGRLLTVFGCGGDRDGAKRPLMGEAVRDLSDVAVVTSDNPRTEDPGAIIEMILPGVSGSTMPRISNEQLKNVARGYAVEPDRRIAIFSAVRAANPGDVVLIAGKGHEDYQILGTKKIHFDDREEARHALAELKVS